MKAAVGVAVRAGAPKPDVSSSEAIKALLRAAPSIGYSDGPSGDHVVSLIARFGVTDQVKPKLRAGPNGCANGDHSRHGRSRNRVSTDQGLIHAPGVHYVGPLPPDIQQITVYSAGIHTGAKQPEAAKALMDVLTSSAAATVIKNHGMDPP